MALTHVGLYGTAADKTLGNTLDVFSPASAIPAGRVLLCAVACDNTATSDGPSTSVASVVGSFSGTFTKALEYTNNASGAATGSTISLWYKRVTTPINAGDDTVTVTFASNVVAKLAYVEIFNTTNPSFSVQASIGGVNDTDPLALTLSGLPSKSYLFVRADALEAGTFGYTPSTNYTAIGTHATNAPGDATDMSMGWEYRIVTATGDTTDPTMSPPQSASVYVAFQETNSYTLTADKATFAVGLKTATLVRNTVTPHAESWSTQSSASTTSLACTLPGFLLEGALMVSMVVTTGSVTPSMPAGWTLIKTLPNGTTSSDPRISVFGKFAGASEVAPSVTLSAAGEVLCAIIQVQGANPSSLLQTNSDATGTGSSVTYTSLTTTQANSFILSSVGLVIGSAVGTDPPTGFTEIVDFGQTTLALNIGSKVQAAAGSTGAITGTITNGTTSKWAAELVAISGQGVASYRMGATTAAMTLGLKNAALATTSGGTNTGGTTTFSTKNFTALTTEIANPERGWFTQTVGDQAVTYYQNLRSGSDLITVVRALIYLNTWINTDTLPQSFIDGLRTQFTNIRNGGAKAVIRFSYSQDSNGADAPLTRLLGHIDQITPVIQEFADVILIWEAGFVGGWGEWAFSTNYGTPNPPLANYGLTNQQWADRKAIVDKLLTVVRGLPYWRTITLRTPAFAFNMYGTTAISDANRFNDSATSRLGQSNDAFLSSASDMNTYRDIPTEYPWLAQQTKWTPMLGESAAYVSGRSDCPTATSEMAQFHWSLCHSAYHPTTLSAWQTQGCYEAEMSIKLGYRLRLTQAILPDNIYSGSLARIQFTMVNEGYAAPISKRPLNLVLKRVSNGALTRIKMNIDVRDWIPGTYNIDQSVQLPTLPSGSYQLFLELPDEAPNLATNPLYSIQLANTGIYDSTTGFNNLNHTAQASVQSAPAYALAANVSALTITRNPALFQKTYIAGMQQGSLSISYKPATFNRGRSMVATTLAMSISWKTVTSRFNMAAAQQLYTIGSASTGFRRTYVMQTLTSAVTIQRKNSTLVPGFIGPNGGGGGSAARGLLMQKFQNMHQRQVSEQRLKLAGTHHTNAAQKAAQNAAKQAEAKRKAAQKRRMQAEIKDLDEEVQTLDEMIGYQPQFKIHPPALEQIMALPEVAQKVATPQRMRYTNPAIQDEEQALELILLNII